MQLKKTSNVDDVFTEELKKKMILAGLLPHVDKRLEEQREEENHQHVGGTLELILEDDRENNKVKAQEAMLRSQERTDAPNENLNGTTEARLEKASKEKYPHRNEEAWKRTEEKRPVNALEKEMGTASDQKKEERWDKAQKQASIQEIDDLDKEVEDLNGALKTDTELDNKSLLNNKQVNKEVKDVSNNLKNMRSKQVSEDLAKVQPTAKPLAAYNRKQIIEAEKAKIIQQALGTYIDYKSIRNPWDPKLIEAQKIDSVMSSIMAQASSNKRELNSEEKSQIEALKKRKNEVLGIDWK